MSKFIENTEVPVSKRTVSPSIKDSQDNPGSSCEQKADKIQAPGFPPDPAEKIEDYEACVKDCKEDVKKFHLSLFSPQADQ